MERIAPVMFDAAAIEMLVKHVDETVRGLGIITDGIDSASEKGVRLLVVCEFLCNCKIFSFEGIHVVFLRICSNLFLNQHVTKYFLFSDRSLQYIYIELSTKKHATFILITYK